MEQVTVYRREGRYCGWPANYGAWSWGEEIVAGFTLGYMGEETGGLHATDTRRPQTPMQGRRPDVASPADPVSDAGRPEPIC